MQDQGHQSTPMLAIGPGAGLLPFETGARFFATLAFPGSHERQARLEAEQAWIASQIHEHKRTVASDEPFAEQRLNELARLEESWIRQKLRTARRRLRNRGEAARLARPWTGPMLGSAPHRPVKGIKRFTARQIALHLCGNDDEAAHNFQKRVWRPSRPVLHYAAVIDYALNKMNPGFAEGPISLDEVDVFRAAVFDGNDLATKIAADPRFGISADGQFFLQWVD